MVREANSCLIDCNNIDLILLKLQKDDKIRFEMDSEQLEETLAKFQKIKDKMNQLGSN